MLYYGVTDPGLVVMYFVTERPDEPGLIIEDDVRVDPLDFMTGSLWPEGTPRPEQVLCRSKADPKFYKQFKYRADFDPAEFEETGRAYGGTYSLERYRQLRGRVDRWGATKKALDALPLDPNETDEAWGEILHNLGVISTGEGPTRR